MMGWGIVVVANFLLQLIKADFDLTAELFSALILFTYGVTVTHALRFVYQKLNLLSLSLLKITGAVMGLSLLGAMTMVMLALSSLYIYYSLTGQQEEIFSFNMLLGNLIGMFPMVVLWSTLYMAINYLLNWKQSEIDKLSLESALKDAQLNTLIGQVNPHFMFNSLNNIRSLINEDVDKARDAITQLSKVLRYSLTSHKSSLTQLAQELEIVTDYINIAKIQYEDRLDFQSNVPRECEKILIPPMLIQMLVENSVKHGIAETKRGGTLKLECEKVNEELVIRVSNPGTLKRNSSAFNSTGLGLDNIQKRLSLIYGALAHFEIQAQEDSVLVTLKLPIKIGRAN
jgi:two-component system, LytTR family, sensor kinase